MAQLVQNILLWQTPEWPYFQWDSSALLDSLVQVRLEQGRLLGLTTNWTQQKNLTPIQLDLIENFNKPLTEERLNGWQASLFPTGFSGVHKIVVGDYRKKDSILGSNEQLPSATRISDEMKKFFDWWNESPVGLDGIIRAGIAYFWFMTVRPYEDGNSELAIAVLNFALAEDEKSVNRHYDIQKHIDSTEALKVIQSCHRMNGDITLWLNWLFEKLKMALLEAQKSALILSEIKTYSRKLQEFDLNFRQKKILNFLLSKKNESIFITNRQCVDLCNQSRESIKRDLQSLVNYKILLKSESKGRSTSYFLNLDLESTNPR